MLPKFLTLKQAQLWNIIQTVYKRNTFSVVNSINTFPKFRMAKAKVFNYVKAFKGMPTEENFQLVEEELPALKDGEFLAEAIYLSVDPYMRGFAWSVPVGGPFTLGTQVAKILESKNAKFPVNKYIVGAFGWRSLTVSTGVAEENVVSRNPVLIPDFGGLPLSFALGVLGMPGNTAYFGVTELLKPKAGETVVVSGAAGAVGSVAGQIAKIKGCKVIGIAGSNDKGEWLVKDLGFDQYINYKTTDVAKALQSMAPQGVDCYFDNVAGKITVAVIQNMNRYGRVAVCGIISTHNEDVPTDLPGISPYYILRKELKIEGYNVHRWTDKWLEGINKLKTWIQEGQLKYRETVTEGFKNMPTAFVDLYKGGNTGKAIIRA